MPLSSSYSSDYIVQILSLPMNISFRKRWYSFLDECLDLFLPFVFFCDANILLLQCVSHLQKEPYDNSNKHAQDDIWPIKWDDNRKILFPIMNHKIKKVAEIQAIWYCVWNSVAAYRITVQFSELKIWYIPKNPFQTVRNDISYIFPYWSTVGISPLTSWHAKIPQKNVIMNRNIIKFRIPYTLPRTSVYEVSKERASHTKRSRVKGTAIMTLYTRSIWNSVSQPYTEELCIAGIWMIDVATARNRSKQFDLYRKKVRQSGNETANRRRISTSKMMVTMVSVIPNVSLTLYTRANWGNWLC